MIIPAQIRAGRALLDWSQEQLAEEAEVALSTVRDTENERRAADTTAVKNIRRALWNGGVVFVQGRQDEGPGVRLVANRPNIVRRPTTMQTYEGMPFAVEWQGKVVTVFVAYEVIDDLDGHCERQPDDVYLKTFDRHRGEILDAITLAIVDPENFDQAGRLYIRQKDLDALKQGSWHRLSIDTGEDVREAAVTGLMNKFLSLFIKSGLPNDVQVFRDLNDASAHVYYFSPKAAAIAQDLLATYHAIPCAKPVNLPLMRKVKF
jgi:transcriptional regulator with XRE-family HTH domain